MRSVAPTAAMQRQLDALLKPKPKRGQPERNQGVMVVPLPVGWQWMTQSERENDWCRIAAQQQAALLIRQECS